MNLSVMPFLPLDPGLMLGFLLAAVVLVLTPGPDTLFVSAHGLSHGPRGGLVAAMGTATGVLGHALIAAVGLGALITASAAAFALVRWAGAAYLLWLGLMAMKSAIRPAAARASAEPSAPARPRSLRAIYSRAILVNLLNPKAILFFLALLPQFAAAERGHVGLQLFVLTAIMAVLSLLWLGLVGMVAGRAAGWLRQRGSLARWLDGVTGAIFLGLALRLLGEDSGR